jgi:hypothetical protein
MAFNPDNQQLLSLSVSEGTDYFVREKNLNYLMYTTAVGTGIGGTIGGANRIYTNTAKTNSRQGFRFDISDTKDAVIVGDKVVLTVSEAGSPLPSTQTYDVIKVITPEIQKKSGQYVSFQNIKSTPISVKTPQTNRTYEFDISINITDITS